MGLPKKGGIASGAVLVVLVVAALAKEIGSKAWGDVADKLKQGDFAGAGEAAKDKVRGADKALNSLFGR